MFTENLAEQMKTRTGEKYRPSNGTEGHIFESEFCSQCAKFDGCELAMKMHFYDTDEPEYPAEICYGEDGQPTCTQFESTDKPPF